MVEPVSLRWILKVFDLLAFPFPHAWRAEYFPELRQVFARSLSAARASGRSPWPLLLRELTGLPSALASAYWTSLSAVGWRRWLEYGALTLIFLLPAISAFRDLFDPSFLTILALILSNFMTIALVSGVVLGFPRWYLPYAGFLLAFLLLQGAALYFQGNGPLFGDAPAGSLSVAGRLARALALEGLLDGLLLLLVGLGGLLAHRWVIPRLRRGESRALAYSRRWSDLSFMFYGAASLAAVLSLEQYRYIEPVSFLSVLILIAGGVIYLHTRTPASGLVALLAAVALAFTVIAAGKWLLIPLQDWPGWFETHPIAQERWYEAGVTLIDMAALCLLISAPAAWHWLAPRLRGRIRRPA